MKFLILLALAFSAVLAAPPAKTDDIQLLKSDFSNDPTGYNFAFEQSDGQRRDETGEVRNAGDENEFVAVRGSFSFTGKSKDQKFNLKF